MTTDTAAPNPTDKPEHHGSCSPARASQFEKARPHQNTTPISTLARRAPSSNLNMWEERIRPQKPQLSPCIPPPLKNQLCTKKRGTRLKYQHRWRFVFGARRTATRRPRVVRREKQRWQAGAARRVLSWCLNGSGWASTVTHCQLLCGYHSDNRQFVRLWTVYPVKESYDGSVRCPADRGRSPLSLLFPLFGAVWLFLRLAPPFLAGGWFRQTGRSATAQSRTYRPSSACVPGRPSTVNYTLSLSVY